jgi:hypothetical protein
MGILSYPVMAGIALDACSSNMLDSGFRAVLAVALV